MRTPFAICISIGLLLQISAGPVTGGKVEGKASANLPASKPVAAKGAELAALEGKLLGTWRGPACGGDFTFNRDGTFIVESFTPGQCTLTGSWSIRWDALPPTLLLTFKTSDFKKRLPGEPEYQYVGKTLEAKLTELGNVLAFRAPNTEWNWRGDRGDEK